MSELQATIDDLEEGGFNFIGNLDLKDALSNQFPGLNNASNGAKVNETSSAVNELQQAVNQLENGGINSISSADIQSALRNQFPDIAILLLQPTTPCLSCRQPLTI